ncbi:MAG TPA: hypothetical protein VJ877_04400, partial [Bacteroidales bacterium]|nr:hypothetical protein [Bacteroidales bacterium]
MKRKFEISVIMMVMLLLASCDGPDALLINIVGADGSVTRKVILTYTKDEFDLSDCQVPVDSTWNITRNMDVSEEGDTTYSLTALKKFSSVDEINRSYAEYKGANPGMVRYAAFDKKFQWFHSRYRYTETVEKAIEGISPENYFSEEQLDLFYMPEKLIDKMLEGPDSSKVKANLIEPMEDKYDEWLGRSLVRALVNKILDTVAADPEIKIDTAVLRKREKEISASLVFSDMDQGQAIDTLMGQGFYLDNQSLMDTLLSDIEEEFDVAFSADDYIVQTDMPGELMSTNGYIDEDGKIIWKVNGDAILSSDYIMFAESRIRNTWAWIVTGAFVLFVISG